MELQLLRRPAADGVILGDLLADSVHVAHTLEDADEAIPVGVYPVVITYSLRFKRLLPLVDRVPGRQGIRIHPGNTADDTTGCILLGLSQVNDEVLHSREACQRFQSLIAPELARGRPVRLTVTQQSPFREVQA